MKKAISYLTDPLHQLLCIKGRTNRKSFWLYTLWILPLWYIAFLVLFIGMVSVGAEILPPDSHQGFGWLCLFISVPLMTLLLVGLLLAICIRRLHDQNKSAWWTLLLLVPYLGFLIIFILMLLSGTKGKNSYGEPNC